MLGQTMALVPPHYLGKDAPARRSSSEIHRVQSMLDMLYPAESLITCEAVVGTMLSTTKSNTAFNPTIPNPEGGSQLKRQAGLRVVIRHLLSRRWVNSERREKHPSLSFKKKKSKQLVKVSWSPFNPLGTCVPFPCLQTMYCELRSHKFLATISFQSSQTKGIFSHFGLDWI